MNKILITAATLLVGSAATATIYGINYYSNYQILDMEQWNNIQQSECSIEGFNSLSQHDLKQQCEQQASTVMSNV